MTAPWTALAWDTDFFGFPIGKVDLDGLDAPAIVEVEQEARAAGITCLYGSLDPADYQATFEVQTLGWRFVEAATLFQLRQSEVPIPRPPGIELRLATEDDLEALDPMVSELAGWSRYAVDPRFGFDASLRLQRAWALRAVTDTTDTYSLMMAVDETGPMAFVTRVRNETPAVDGVGTTARGSGAARYLIEDARAWVGDGPLYGGPIAARNIPCLRYVSHCNYRVTRVRYLYHRWLDEDAR